MRKLPAAFLPRTHCKRGHELTPENTKVYRPPGSKYTNRQCKTCRKATMAAYGIERKVRRILAPAGR